MGRIILKTAIPVHPRTKYTPKPFVQKTPYISEPYGVRLRSLRPAAFVPERNEAPEAPPGTPSTAMTRPAKTVISICAVSAVLSCMNPLDYSLWFFEIFAGLIAMIFIARNSEKYPLSNLLYSIITVHFIILAVAAKYSYAEMPLFNWIKDEFSLDRNHFDRVGHFFQGVTPAILSREILLRNTELPRGKMLFFICTSIPLAFSAFWELIEWFMAVNFYPASAQEWLGTQGDVFDAQGDMFMAMCGAVLAMSLLSKPHDASMGKVKTWGNTAV